jgi:hypothetical protein
MNRRVSLRSIGVVTLLFSVSGSSRGQDKSQFSPAVLRCLAIVPLCARTLRSDPMISLARKSPQSVREVGVTGLAIAIECF